MTATEFDALPEEDGCRWELLDGELIEVSSATPKHIRILLNLAALFLAFARSRRLGTVLVETDLAVGPDSRLRPDVAWFSARIWQSVDEEKVPVEAVPDSAVEIVSPSETAATLQRKTRKYLDSGVHEVWLIYPELRSVYVHIAGSAQRFGESAELTSALIPGFVLPVADLFAT